MTEYNTIFTIANLMIGLPWLLNSLSLLCAYSLSNNKVILGRYIGTMSSIGWGSYGILINEYSFLFANIIFFYIYASAVYKFSKKQDAYKQTNEDQKYEIDRLHRELSKRESIMAKDFKVKKDALLKIKERAKKQLQEIDNIIKFD
jgi:hypothetical protein